MEKGKEERIRSGGVKLREKEGGNARIIEGIREVEKVTSACFPFRLSCKRRRWEGRRERRSEERDVKE